MLGAKHGFAQSAHYFTVFTRCFVKIHLFLLLPVAKVLLGLLCKINKLQNCG